mmetsp:Transcript_21318/g.45365  ORF Transcript_21318/g.45365 Transcript_21318/m.45365 type:complete len:207 (-) Transcript_21318:3234-3854(-)
MPRPASRARHPPPPSPHPPWAAVEADVSPPPEEPHRRKGPGTLPRCARAGAPGAPEAAATRSLVPRSQAAAAAAAALTLAQHRWSRPGAASPSCPSPCRRASAQWPASPSPPERKDSGGGRAHRAHQGWHRGPHPTIPRGQCTRDSPAQPALPSAVPQGQEPSRWSGTRAASQADTPSHPSSSPSSQRPRHPQGRRRQELQCRHPR